MSYLGIVFFGQSLEMAGRGLTAQRLRTVAQRNNFNILAIDFACDINEEEILNIISSSISEETKFLGFSTSWVDRSNLESFVWMNERFFKIIKERYPHLKIITGGHESWNKNYLIKHSDYHFHGFSDNTFVEFMKMITGQSYKLSMTKNVFMKGHFIDSNITDPVTDPNEIETVFIKEDGFLPHQPVPMEFSRGCIFRCGFCRHPFQGKKDYDSYQRSAENMAIEMKRNYDLFGTTRYIAMDDTFNDSIEKLDRVRRAIDIAKLPDFEMVAFIKPELLVTKEEMIPILSELGLRGAFVGIESMKQQTRSSIGKGTSIERVTEACMRMASYGTSRKTLIHGNFIVGLPYESRDEVLRTQEYLIANRHNLFKSWYYYPLHVKNDKVSPKESLSLFDRNFADYGYRIPENSNAWENDYFTSVTATHLVDRLNKEALQYRKYAGWHVAGAWHAGRTNDQLDNEMFTDNFMGPELKANARQRALIEYNRLTGRSNG